jgi:hypothetical protein
MRKMLTVPLIMTLSGCSLLLVEGPPSNWQTADGPALQAMAVQPCTDSQIVPRLDGIFAGLNSIAGAYLLLTGTSSYRVDQRERNQVGGITLGWGLLQFFSYGNGSQKVNDCRAFKARMLELSRENE